jgi:hypothetical protein
MAAYASAATFYSWTCSEEPPPAFVSYRSCDTVTPCQDVERWIAARGKARAQTSSLRLGDAKHTEPSCVTSARLCKNKRGNANHYRWPKCHDRQMLEYLARYSLEPR